MTDLSEITARQTEHQRLGLLQEAVYWRSQPEVLEDPVALELATRGADLLTEERPPGQQYPLKRVRKCLRRLHERLTRRRDECVARSMADVFATAPPSAARGEKKRGKKAETLQEETPTLFLGACTLLPAWELGREHEGSPLPWEDFAATRLLGLHGPVPRFRPVRRLLSGAPGAVRKNHSTGGATDTEIDSFTIRWFNLACDRGGGRKERGKDRCQQEA
ncbi:uncharacterized protein [Paramormyrops kingsleyae]|uniref:uncharacterized protein isoform X1 n=1 Tax=Paramormyrops kingsleyae TaxID=1676925 RepID=UPI003B975AAA